VGELIERFNLPVQQGRRMTSYHPLSRSSGAKFSIIIPSWNNLKFLELCIESITKNSEFEHQVIVHVNEGNDGTAGWLKDKKIDHTCSENNVGICYGVNAAASLAVTDYILYMNDDMYACPAWDKYLWEEIETIGHSSFFLSSTMIERTRTGNDCVLAPFDFGDCPENFKEEQLLSEHDTMQFDDWNGATWPPNVVHRRLWELVEGLSVEFSPGMYSDPDLSMKLWQAGVRHFKGIGKSKVYHFRSRSVGRIRKNDGRRLFLHKWGVSSSFFCNKVLLRGKPFTGPLPDAELNPGVRDRLKKLFS
jgi:glycosyltransferase involved in cell wall biosynthesis